MSAHTTAHDDWAELADRSGDGLDVGRLSATGRLVYRGEPVTFATSADGAHTISVIAGVRVVACGVLPGMS